jgi:hypothetical protein
MASVVQVRGHVRESLPARSCSGLSVENDESVFIDGEEVLKRWMTAADQAVGDDVAYVISSSLLKRCKVQAVQQGC